MLFRSGTTDALNLVAQSYARAFLEEGDEIIITTMEHHSNIVPWQMIRDEKGLVLKAADVDEEGAFHLSALEALITERTKIIAVPHVSNVLGTVLPVKEIFRTRGSRTRAMPTASPPPAPTRPRT